MAFKDEASKKWNEFKQKLQDKRNHQRVEEEIRKRLEQGREALSRLEKELTDPENRRKAEAKIKEARAKLAKMRTVFKKKEAQAAAYTKKNPEKALVVAAAAGALAGALWVAFHRKK